MRYEDVVSNVKVYGLEESVRGSKYPMAVDLSTVNGEITERTLKLARAVPGSGHDNFLNIYYQSLTHKESVMLLMR